MESRFNTQTLITWVVMVLCAGLVLYPLVFLVQVALNTGDAQTWPPAQYGLDNFDGLLRAPKVAEYLARRGPGDRHGGADWL
jgi:ABC-type spermidine/putrescine transport system permease subunit II